MPSNAPPDPHHPYHGRSKQTIDDILEATAHVLKQVGFYETTTDRIAARACLNVGSLYQYFPNKIALYEALMMRHFEILANAAFSLAQQLSDASADEFPDVLAAILLTTERKDPPLSALLHQIAAAHPTVAAVEIEHSRALEMALATLLGKKRNETGFRAELDPDIASRVLTRALAGLARRTMEIEPSEVRQLIRGYVIAR
jgi:AcrR family transcriptional regulator